MPYLASIIQSCPLIQELEIMGSEGSSRFPRISEKELSSIALLGSNLKRLTLADFSVNSGLFLEDILKSCNQLESLRLNSLSQPGFSFQRGGPHLKLQMFRSADPCCYVSNLITALPLAKKLKTFW